jgi:arsenite-transporting ATPase
MNEILRDNEHVSIRLVMTPDRMVVDEARRTFTYLNLYGYLTDAVVVNRVFGAEVGDYFGAWRERQQEQLVSVRDAFAPVPVLQAPYFEEEVVGGAMLDRLGDALFADGVAAHALHHHSVSERLELGTDGATLRLDLPFAERGDISLKRLGSELIVRVDGHKRTMLLPPALDDLEPTGAAFADGALTISFTPVAVADGA